MPLEGRPLLVVGFPRKSRCECGLVPDWSEGIAVVNCPGDEFGRLFREVDDLDDGLDR